MKIEIEVEYKLNCTGYVILEMSEDDFNDLSEEQKDEELESRINFAVDFEGSELDDFSGIEILNIKKSEE